MFTHVLFYDECICIWFAELQNIWHIRALCEVEGSFHFVFIVRPER